MTLQVQILIPAGQAFKAEAVYHDTHDGETRETLAIAEVTPGVIHSLYATSTRSIEIRELAPTTK